MALLLIGGRDECGGRGSPLGIKGNLRSFDPTTTCARQRAQLPGVAFSTLQESRGGINLFVYAFALIFFGTAIPLVCWWPCSSVLSPCLERAAWWMGSIRRGRADGFRRIIMLLGDFAPSTSCQMPRLRGNCLPPWFISTTWPW